MPAPRRPWPPSRPSRPLSLRESVCGRASRQQPPSPFSYRDPSRLEVARAWRGSVGTRMRRESSARRGLGNLSNSLRARCGKLLELRQCGETALRGRCGAAWLAQSGAAHGRWRWRHAGGGGAAWRRRLRVAEGVRAVQRTHGRRSAARAHSGGVERRWRTVLAAWIGGAGEADRAAAASRVGKTKEVRWASAGKRDI